LIAVTKEHKVGVDVERIRSDMELESIVNHYFSQREVSEFLALPSEQRVTGFFACWTRKEAYIKAQGLGLSLPLESFDVSLTPNGPVSLRATRPDPQEAARWTLFDLEVDPRYAAALAVEGAALSKGKGLELRLWDWDITNQ
jgi:4'-phosphopantetheinyl transferase